MKFYTRRHYYIMLLDKKATRKGHDDSDLQWYWIFLFKTRRLLSPHNNERRKGVEVKEPQTSPNDHCIL